ncbi:hypothetical protein ACHMW7_23970 [Aminobacter sp. UC22_36]|uniref:hypothetical protein n=1 Tax=Aminobacter sp. UC22_36 TaxID=3374549 RepID=UPI0037564D63
MDEPFYRISPESFDFEIALGALRRISPLPTDFRALAPGLITEFCPDETYPDELVDALVKLLQPNLKLFVGTPQNSQVLFDMRFPDNRISTSSSQRYVSLTARSFSVTQVIAGCSH